jgi:hypothetical protein
MEPRCGVQRKLMPFLLEVVQFKSFLVSITLQLKAGVEMTLTTLASVDLGPTFRLFPNPVDSHCSAGRHRHYSMHDNECLDFTSQFCSTFCSVRKLLYRVPRFGNRSVDHVLALRYVSKEIKLVVTRIDHLNRMPQDPEARSLVVGVAIAGYYAVAAWSQVLVWPTVQAPYCL